MNNKTRVHVSKGQSKESANVLSNERIIDWTSIMEVCSDENIVEDFVKIFLEDVSQIMECIADAVKKENAKDVDFYAHRLKGAALHVAAKKLAEKTYRLGCAGKEEDTGVFAFLFEDVKGECEKVTSFLSKADWIEIAKEQNFSKQQIEWS